MSAKVDFFDLPSKNEPSPAQTKSGDDFFSLPSSPNTWKKPEPPSTGEQLETAAPLFSQHFLAGLWALPSMTAETWRHLGGKLQKFGEEQAAREGRELSPQEKAFTENVVNFIPDLIKKGGEKAPSILPTYQQAKQKVGEKIRAGGGKLPEQPRGNIEKAASGAGDAATILAFPASVWTKAAAIGTGAATEAADLSEGSKIGANIGIPAATALLEALIKKRYLPSSALKDLYDESKALGFTDEQLAPIFATESQIERHGPLAQGTKGTKKAFEETYSALGNAIDDLSSRPSASTVLSSQAENNLINKLSNIRNNLQSRTHSLSDKEKQLIDFIDTAVTDIRNNGSNPKKLIGTWRSMNKIGQGKTALRELETPILEAIESVDPQISKDLSTTNKLYSKYVQNLKEISPSQFNAFIDAGELQQVLSAVFSPQQVSLPEKLLNLVGLKALRKISSSILTDPQAQSLVRNFGQAVRDGRPASARALVTQLQQYVQKNLPEEYKEVDWDKLMSSNTSVNNKNSDNNK